MAQKSQFNVDVILGSWSGIHDGRQSTDDNSIITYQKRQGKYKYVGVITNLGPTLQSARFSKGEEIVWLNPSETPGVYKGICRRRLRGTGVPSDHALTVNMLSTDRCEHTDDIGTTTATRISATATAMPVQPAIVGMPCEGLIENTKWLYGVTKNDAKAFLLSPPADEGEYSKTLVELNSGEFFVFRFKIVDVKSGGKFGRVFEILNRVEKRSGWVLSFDEGRDHLVTGYLVINGDYLNDHAFEVGWYKPGEYNKVAISYCGDGSLRLNVNGYNVTRYVTQNSGPLPVAVRAYALDVAVDG